MTFAPNDIIRTRYKGTFLPPVGRTPSKPVRKRNKPSPLPPSTLNQVASVSKLRHTTKVSSGGSDRDANKV